MYIVSLFLTCVQSQIEWSANNLYVYIGVPEKDITLLGIVTRLEENAQKVGIVITILDVCISNKIHIF